MQTVSTFVLLGVVIGALRDLHYRERRIGDKIDFIPKFLMGSFHNNSPTTVKTIAEVPAVTPIPKNEDYSNQSASIILKTEETESNPPSSADATIDSSSS